MKNKTTLMTVILLASFHLAAQHSLVINQGHFKLSGSVEIVLQDVQLVNHGTLTDTSGTWVLSGSSVALASHVSGDSVTMLNRLKVDRTTGPAKLGRSVRIHQEVDMASGQLELNGHNITLDSAAMIINETPNTSIIGSGGGEVLTTLTLNAPVSQNPGSLGATITSAANLGSTTIRRGNTVQNIGGQNSVQRYYTITPTNNTGLNATLRMAYFDSELNGNTETELEPFRSNGTSWQYHTVSDSSTLSNYFETSNVDAFSTWTLASGGLKVIPKILLEGSHAGGGLMTDLLRSGGLIPLIEPYTGLGYSFIGGGGGEAIDTTVLLITGNNAIVDWIVVELRDKSDHTIVLKSRAALLQKDGDIVDIDGISPLALTGVSSDNYFVAVNHRNHLDIMSANSVPLTIGSSNYDFTTSSSATFGGTNGIADLSGGFFGLYSGDVNGNGQVQNTDATALTPNIGSSGYSSSDLDMNGQVQNTDLQVKLTPNTGKGEQHN